MKLRPMEPADWPAVAEIYREGIATGHATFNTEAPSWEEWDRSHLAACRLVAVDGGEVLGWAAMIPVSDRCVYAGVAEESVYVSARARGKGVGRLLLEGLIAASEDQGIWTLQAGIFPENTASIALHERLGFRLVGRRERLGKTAAGQWRDVLMLERRSDRVGTA
ncbi:MAG TPA: N-acetyltransferase family protein [Gemmatimonadales bacterium]|jgi:L-amino acid N-acyltransferase YncA|nr:N-acetyltransferase family protein [Gemmatimonadales bacterium]